MERPDAGTLPEAGRTERLLGTICTLYLMAAPLLYVPGLPAAIGDIRSIAPAVAAVLLCIYAGLGILRTRRARLPYVRPLAFLYLVPLVAALSAIASLSQHLSLFGFNGETGSVLGWIGAALAAAAGFSLLAERRRALLFIAGLTVSSALVAVSSLAVVLVRALSSCANDWFKALSVASSPVLTSIP